ncbi:MAG TPA: class I SAM-dependent methyltransferase [Pyrinomonadaceae bacterium]|nr:class I SAM-dependent methyltransferase [Pyrinomonadaceae bacterium]
MTDLRDGYDRVAADYAREFADELDGKPFDRKMLDWLAEKVGGRGPICDMGCGPGQTARYLHTRGVEACGVDLSPEMVRHARRLNPDIPFQQGDMLALSDAADETYGGVAAFYSLIHVPRPRLVEALGELKRVLRPAGTLLVTFHLGRETVHKDEFFGQEVSLDFHFFESAEMKEHLAAAGFRLEETIERDPYPPEVEYQSRRAYIFARKP